jgi:hypothetical protein
MPYREDRDADQARITALEQELATAKQRIATLEVKQSTALAVASKGAVARYGDLAARQARWFGAPLELAMSRVFDGAFPADRLEELLGRIRSVWSDPGAVELLRASMTWRANVARHSGPTTVVHVMIKDGQTTLTVTDRLANLAGGLYGGIGGGVGGGGLVIPIMASIAVPVLAPVFLAGWLGGVIGGARALFKHVARRRAIAVQQLFDALVADIDAVLVAARR